MAVPNQVPTGWKGYSATQHAILEQISNHMKLAPPKSQPFRALPVTQGLPIKSSTYPESDQLFPDAVVRKAEEFLASPRNFEIELSFGTFKIANETERTAAFVPGVTLAQFVAAKAALIQTGLVPIHSSSSIEIQQSVSVRKITDRDAPTVIMYETKKKLETVDNPDFGYRISKSTERRENSAPKNFKPDILRCRERYSFRTDNEDGLFYGVIFDLTAIHEYQLNTNANRNVKDQQTVREKYEIEIEREKTVPNVSVNVMRAAAEFILDAMNNSAVTGQPFMSLDERRDVVKYHNYLFREEMKSRKIEINNPYRLYKDYWNKPKNIKVENLIDPRSNWAITPKLDGKRGFLLVLDSGLYVIAPPEDVWKIGAASENNKEYVGTLLDGEYVERRNDGVVVDAEYMVFDILFYKGRDVRTATLMTRLRYKDEVASSLVTGNASVSVRPKSFVTDEAYLYDKLNQAIEQARVFEDRGYSVDGFIFQPYTVYKNNYTFKWKPASSLTIDFKLMPVEDKGKSASKCLPKGKGMFYTLVGSKDVRLAVQNVNVLKEDKNVEGEEIETIDRSSNSQVVQPSLDVIFKGTEQHPFAGTISIPGGLFEGTSVSGRIVECKYDVASKTFTPLRFREDRDRPNNIATATDVWRDIMNPIPIATLKGTNLQAMRKFHNNIKGEVLADTLKGIQAPSIIDVGSGRGGDLQKWNYLRIGDGKETLHIKNVYAVEPSSNNRAIMNERLRVLVNSSRGYNTKVHIVPSGIENTDAITAEISKTRKDPHVDAMFSFFSLTFIPKDEATYEGFFDTLNKTVPEGGFFSGIVMDGGRVRKLLDEQRVSKKLADDDAASFESDAFSITQASFFTDSKFGNEIVVNINDPDSMVKEQTEYLLDFDRFSEDLAKLGFVEVDGNFLDVGAVYGTLPFDSQVFSGLNRAFVFQRKGMNEKEYRAIEEPEELADENDEPQRVVTLDFNTESLASDKPKPIKGDKSGMLYTDTHVDIGETFRPTDILQFQIDETLILYDEVEDLVGKDFQSEKKSSEFTISLDDAEVDDDGNYYISGYTIRQNFKPRKGVAIAEEKKMKSNTKKTS